MATEISFCRKCGKHIPSDSAFCCFCGAPVVNVSSKVEQAPVASVPSTTPQVRYPEHDRTYQVSLSDINRPNSSVKHERKKTNWFAIVAIAAIAIFIYAAIFPGSNSNSTSNLSARATPTPVAKPTNKPLTLPTNGQVFVGASLIRESELTIDARAADNYYIKLKDVNNKTVFAFFVRAGQSATVEVPAGKYYVYFASGENWYGTNKVFGEDTVYSKDDDLQDFSTYTLTYTLYPVTNGNFVETPISADDF